MKRAIYMTTGALALSLAFGGAAFAHGMKGGQQMRGAGPAMLIEQFDLNADGKVTAEEFEQAKAARFAEADADGDGFLSPEELSAAVEKMRAQAQAARTAARQQAMLDRLDADEDGKLSPEEMANAGPGPQMFTRMLDRLDADEDGAISTEELETARANRGNRRYGENGTRGGHKMRGHGDHGRGGEGRMPWWLQGD
mgnify:CR=1 FL=1